jgi:amidohydrolase
MRRYIEEVQNEIIGLNDFLAQNPEIGGEEFKASSSIVDILRKYEIEVEYPFAGMDTAFRGIINKGKERKAVILAEYDALRGIGHGCGHCASGSISLLAALVLNSIKETIPAEIHLIGTPDEEMRGGKVTMANLGIFDEYDFAVMIHMSNKNAVYSGFLALDAYEFSFHGKPAHAASIPWEGRNALNAARLFMDATDMMRQHVKDDVRLHGYIKSGGDASNTVPHLAVVEMLVRAKDRVYINELSQWVMDCAKAASIATRTTWRVEQLGEKFDGLKRIRSGEKYLERIYKELNLPLTDMGDQTGGSSDIGNVSSICPAFHPYISIGEGLNGHTLEFAQAMTAESTHRAILDGGEIIARFIRDIYCTPGALEELQLEFNNK